jgi:hypothetical protein
MRPLNSHPTVRTDAFKMRDALAQLACGFVSPPVETLLATGLAGRVRGG